jgi:presenilin-like A22 family membrane protease
MKHTVKISLIIVALFFIIQMIGLNIVNQYGDSELPLGIERPEVQSEFSYIPLLVAIIFATGIALILIKLGAVKVWKAWFFIATLYLLTIAFGAFFDARIAIMIALFLILLRTFRRSVISHNFVELFVYAGIPVIFAPILSIVSVSVVLVFIAIYDMIAVWKTKHMVKLAKFQTNTKVFAGLMIPYDNGKKAAILGGGDLGFPMLFASVVLLAYGWIPAILTSIFAAIGLLALLILSKKNKFYPAMPFIGAGSFVGFFISLLI